MSFQPIIHCIGGPCDGVILEFNPETMTVLEARIRIVYRPVRTVSSQNELELKYLTTGYSSDDRVSVTCMYRVSCWVSRKETYYFLYHENDNTTLTAILWALKNYRGSGQPIPTVERLGKDLNADYPYPACVKNPNQTPEVVSVDLDSRNIDITKL